MTNLVIRITGKIFIYLKSADYIAENVLSQFKLQILTPVMRFTDSLSSHTAHRICP